MLIPYKQKGNVENRAAVAGLLSNPGDGVVITRGIPRWLFIRCPCGCGEDIPVNLDARAGKAWRLYHDAKTGTSLYPSVWRDTGCGSHFILRRNQIYLFVQDEEDFDVPFNKRDLETLAQRAIARWPASGYVYAADAADTLGEGHWDVLDACRLLVKAGHMVEGTGQLRGAFQRSR